MLALSQSLVGMGVGSLHLRVRKKKEEKLTLVEPGVMESDAKREGVPEVRVLDRRQHRIDLILRQLDEPPGFDTRLSVSHTTKPALSNADGAMRLSHIRNRQRRGVRTALA
eukprot:3368154-Rhodomonas_salina.6